MGDFDSPRHRLNQAVVSGKISGLVVGHVNPLERDSPLRANFNLVCDAGAGKVILVPCEAYGGLAKSLCLHDHKDGLVSLVAHVAPSGNIGLGRCLVAEAVSSPLKGLGPDTNQVILEGAVTALDLSPVGRADCFSLRMEREGKPFLVRCNVPGGRYEVFLGRGCRPGRRAHGARHGGQRRLCRARGVA